MSWRPFNRGTSVLAALVFVAILGVVALGVNALSPVARGSQTAATVGAIPGATGSGYQDVQTSSGFPTQTGAPQKPDACTEAKKAAASGDTALSLQSSKSSPDVFDACVGAVLDSSKNPANPSDPNSYKCVGRSAVVAMSGATVTDKSVPNASVPAGQCKTMACEPGTNGKMNCFNATLSGGLRSSSLATTLGGGNEGITPFSLDDSNNKFYDSSGLPRDLNTTYAMDQAFAEQKMTTEGNLADVNKQIDTVDQNLKALEFSCGSDVGCGDAGLQDLQAQKEALLAKQSELQNQMSGLSNPDQQATLKYGDQPDTSAAPSVGDCKNNNGALCYAQSQSDVDALTSKGYSCQAAGDYSVCTAKGTVAPWTGPQQPQQPPCSGANCSRQPGGNVPNPGPSTPVPQPQGGGGLGGGGFGGALQSMLGGLLKGFSQGLSQQAAQSNAPACSSDPNAYAQQQQQYNMQLQQYNLQLQQYNYQSQMSQLNGYAPPPPPPQPVACQPNTSSNTCAAAPAQPTSGCTGTWSPVTTKMSNGASCTTGWQCVQPTATQPTAQISCQPLVVDVGMSVAISYTCGSATGSIGQGFDTGNALSGSTTVAIANPPQGTNTANFGVRCTNQGLLANAQCSVQIGRPSIVLVATPSRIAPQASSTIGWVTSGMQTCVVSSPSLSDFTAQNATNTSVSGAVVTPPLATSTDFLLHCATVGGNVRDATTTITVSS